MNSTICDIVPLCCVPFQLIYKCSRCIIKPCAPKNINNISNKYRNYKPKLIAQNKYISRHFNNINCLIPIEL